MPVSLAIDDRGVATLSIERPEVRNAFDPATIGQITDLIVKLPAQARVLVLEGKGKVFSAGADLEWMRSMSTYSQEENLQDAQRLHRMLAAIDSCRIPVVGRIHGAAIAGGAGLVACCDIAIASEETVFAFTEVKIGLVPAVISPFVVRKVGYAFARASFLTAERFDAARALQVGLIHSVVPLEGLDDAVAEVVSGLLDSGPQALRHTRVLVDSVAGRQPEEVQELTTSMIAERRVSSEGQEGIAAFLEKRKPNW